MPSVVESFGPLILFHSVVLSQLRVNLMFSKYLLQAPMNTKSDTYQYVTDLFNQLSYFLWREKYL